ncbi:hypothetical protein EW146_g106 [Bondarzewia mesenterica]|uniref:Uncharacterized protein n=1 Tax=Bondarzewia mesenterica TaxID=1095465 RepID=A0A4V3XGH8_9AGAM|nr:hypothetical protein EW146_g106 [Bondarzewia mesenterica]
MPTATGFIKTVSPGTKFTASFTIDDLLYTFAGSLSPSVQNFESNQVTLEYNSIGQLTTRRPFEGKIGKDDFNLTLGNGPKISGTLDTPIDPASTVSGSATWTQN